MADYLYCMINPAIPGVIMIGSAESDPRERMTAVVSRTAGNRSLRIDWVIKVADAAASESALRKALAHHIDPSWPGHFRCDPMRARAAAIELTNLRADEEEDAEQPVVILPAAVLSLGLAVHFLGITNGQSGPSIALIAAALYWVVHATTEIRDERRLA